MIYLDTCLVIYLYERVDVLGDQVRLAFAESQDQEFAISPLVMLESFVGPLKSGNDQLLEDYSRFFSTLRSLDIDVPAYRHAATLRARYGLKTPDALHLAVAQLHDCSALWTNDHRFMAASDGLAVKVV